MPFLYDTATLRRHYAEYRLGSNGTGEEASVHTSTSNEQDASQNQAGSAISLDGSTARQDSATGDFSDLSKHESDAPSKPSYSSAPRRERPGFVDHRPSKSYDKFAGDSSRSTRRHGDRRDGFRREESRRPMRDHIGRPPRPDHGKHKSDPSYKLEGGTPRRASDAYYSSGSSRWNSPDHIEEEEHVPFEHVDKAISGISETTSHKAGPVDIGTTLTDTEKKAFGKLAKLERQKAPNGPSEQREQQTLEDVLEEAMAAIKAEAAEEKSPGAEWKERKLAKSSKPTKSTDSAVSADLLDSPNLFDSMNPLEPESEKQNLSEGEAVQSTMSSTKAADIRRAERERIRELLEHAQTDIELWSVLQKEVLNPIAALELDGSPEAKAAAAARNQKGRRKREIIMPNFWQALFIAFRILRTNFPTSPLPAAIIPTIRSMGPSVYALGASTRLYNQAIGCMFDMYTDIDGIDELLQEMEREVIEPDYFTVLLLENIVFAWQKVRRGTYGQCARVVWEAERYKRSLWTLTKWRWKIGAMVKRQEKARLERQKNRESGEEEGERETVLDAAS